MQEASTGFCEPAAEEGAGDPWFIRKFLLTLLKRIRAKIGVKWQAQQYRKGKLVESQGRKITGLSGLVFHQPYDRRTASADDNGQQNL
jgi:hypothetical protein